MEGAAGPGRPEQGLVGAGKSATGEGLRSCLLLLGRRAARSSRRRQRQQGAGRRASAARRRPRDAAGVRGDGGARAQRRRWRKREAAAHMGAGGAWQRLGGDPWGGGRGRRSGVVTRSGGAGDGFGRWVAAPGASGMGACVGVGRDGGGSRGGRAAASGRMARCWRGRKETGRVALR